MGIVIIVLYTGMNNVGKLEKKWKIQKDFANKLFKDFPKLFKHKEDKMRSLMCFGVMCEKGWYDLIYSLTKQIYDYSKNSSLDIEVVEIKEKFGGLRYYLEGGDKYIYKLIDRAEDESYKICEKCGKIGKLRTKRAWILTLCDRCNKEIK